MHNLLTDIAGVRVGHADDAAIASGVTAVIFCELGFPAPLGRGLFILSRSVGILSHAWEEMSRGSRMKGPMPKSIPYTYSGPGPRKPD